MPISKFSWCTLYCLICVLIVTFPVYAQEGEFNFKNAADYNNYIMKEMAVAVQKNFEYISFNVHPPTGQASSEDFELMETRRKEVTQQIVQSKEKIKRMPPLDGDTRLRDEAVESLTEYQHAFELDYKDIIGLKKKSKIRMRQWRRTGNRKKNQKQK